MRGRVALNQGVGVNWPERMGKHCHYFAGQMKGYEIYDLWLRTGHRGSHDWVEFMCEGEGVFADCLEEISVDSWPAEVTAKQPEKRDLKSVKAYLKQRADDM